MGYAESAREADRLGAARVLLISTERGAQLARALAEPFADILAPQRETRPD